MADVQKSYKNSVCVASIDLNYGHGRRHICVKNEVVEGFEAPWVGRHEPVVQSRVPPSSLSPDHMCSSSSCTVRRLPRSQTRTSVVSSPASLTGVRLCSSLVLIVLAKTRNARARWASFARLACMRREGRRHWVQ